MSVKLVYKTNKRSLCKFIKFKVVVRTARRRQIGRTFFLREVLPNLVCARKMIYSDSPAASAFPPMLSEVVLALGGRALEVGLPL